jgi:hypothetical protein
MPGEHPNTIPGEHPNTIPGEHQRPGALLLSDSIMALSGIQNLMSIRLRNASFVNPNGTSKAATQLSPATIFMCIAT